MPLDVTDQTFQKEVIEESSNIPVLVDFWAPWCGPCRMLGPVLDKLEKELPFRLVKVNTDENQATAGKYRISGIPAVKLFKDGAVVDEFSGAIPEPNVRRFLERHIELPVIKEIKKLSETSIAEAADEILKNKVSGSTAEEILWKAVKEFIGKPEMHRYLSGIPQAGSAYSLSRLSLEEFFKNEVSPEDSAALCDLLSGKEQKALDHFLSMVQNAPREEKAKKKAGLLLCFSLLGQNHELSNEYRRKLSSLLF